MKKFIVGAALAFLAACGADCPKAEPCPNCPAVNETPCPGPTPCPACPDCPPEPPCPVPDPPPPAVVYEDVDHPASDFEINAVLAKQGTLGFYVVDPNSTDAEDQAGVFPMPELHQKVEFTEILMLDTGDSDTPQVAIGTTEGKIDPQGLVISTLCEREYGSACDAVITTNGPRIKKLTINTKNPEKTFSWER